jgi:hypothetical protein
MKRRTSSPPAGTRRPSAGAKNRRVRTADKDARSPGLPKRSDDSIPADRGAREKESLSQGSE